MTFKNFDFEIWWRQVRRVHCIALFPTIIKNVNFLFLFNKNVKSWCMIKKQDLIKFYIPVNTLTSISFFFYLRFQILNLVFSWSSLNCPQPQTFDKSWKFFFTTIAWKTSVACVCNVLHLWPVLLWKHYIS